MWGRGPHLKTTALLKIASLLSVASKVFENKLVDHLKISGFFVISRAFNRSGDT